MSVFEIRMVPKSGLLLMVGTGWDGETLLKARLSARPAHPRALLTVLEGLALWTGRRLPAALAVDGSSACSTEDLLPDGLCWDSPLVEIHLVDKKRRRSRLDGVGDLRQALQLRLPVAS
jgi:hypothetical protein